MQALADFSDSLLGGTVLVVLSVAVGGVVWSLAVLRAWQAPAPLAALALRTVVAGALGLAAAQLAGLATKTLVLWGDVDPLALLGTLEFRAGAVRAALAVALAMAAARLRRRPAARRGWLGVAALAAAVVASGAWLAHAAGRLEGRGPLMALTALHELAAAAWMGGVVQLALAWRATRRTPGLAGTWPILLGRFSRLAVVSVGLLAASAAPLVWVYVGSWAALVGTGYGSLVVTKAALMAAVLGLAAVNFTAVRRGGAAVWTIVPPLVEVEAIVLAILLFAAATLASQPPAADTVAERATAAEVAEVFRPKWPALRTPSVATMQQDPSDPLAVVGGERTHDAYSWSNFSHNIAGLLLLGMALVALAARGRAASWARHWPLGFLGLAAFVFLRTSANDGVWPFGPRAFWETTLGDPEVLQHRLGAALVLAVGLVEWRARLTRRPGARLPYLFPVLGAAGGVLLLTHAHSAFELRSSYLIQVTHTTMGALAVLMAAARWLELRVAPPAARLAGAASTAAMLLIALVLVFYREANVVVPP